MPHATEPDYKHISVTQLAPTFAAEVSGVDFSKPVADDVFQEILAAITQVSLDPRTQRRVTLAQSDCILSYPQFTMVLTVVVSTASLSSATPTLTMSGMSPSAGSSAS